MAAATRARPPRNQVTVLKCRSPGTSLLTGAPIGLPARKTFSIGLTMIRWVRMPCTTATLLPMIPASPSAASCQFMTIHLCMENMARDLAAVNTHVYGGAMNDRLTKDDWIKHGFRTLAKDGANALKVGPMAEKLKVSRGSFYWHFSDIADFRAQLLRSWQERSTDQVIRQLEAAKAGPDRLKHLMKRAFATKRDLDRAIRSWAAEEKDVARIV